MVDELLAFESGPTEWELNFIENLSRALERGYSLSRARIVKLEEIWEKMNP